MSFVNALQTYIDHPEKHKDEVVYNDKEVVIIKDLYPKALRHYLIIPRSPDISHIHPLEVFQGNVELYGSISNYIDICKDIILKDLIAKRYLSEDKLANEEFKNTFIKAGVHSIPSLKNLHIHVITRDFHSSRLKNKKHYNSFNTDFFVNFEQLEDLVDSPSSQNSSDSGTDKERSYGSLERDNTKLMDLIKYSPLTCSYCKKCFRNKFQNLKSHLNEEYLLKFPNASSVS